MKLDLLLAGPHLPAFLLASLLLALTPGPGVVYIVTRSLWQGRLSGLASVAGVALGNLANALAACFGVAALLAVSALALVVIQYLGAGYLAFLGVQLWRKPMATAVDAQLPQGYKNRVFKESFWVALLNPKTTLFFAAFLPQFLHPALPPLPQSILLSMIFVGIAAISDSGYALAAGMLSSSATKVQAWAVWGRFFGAFIFIGLALVTLVAGVKAL